VFILGIVWKAKMSPLEEGSTRSGLFRALYPDTGESGDTYGIDVLSEPITRTRSLGFKTPSVTASLTLLDAAESGDAYDAEVGQSLGGELEDWPALQTVPRA
jgi:hypothetical protein